MRIGFDAKRIFENSTGLGVYSRTLVHNLAELHPTHQMVLFAPRRIENPVTAPFLTGDRFQVVTPPAWKRMLWRPWLLAHDVAEAGLDLYHGLSNELPVGLDRARTRSVVTIHDLIFRRYPEQYSRVDGAIYQFKFRRACEAADRVIAVSEATRRDIVEQYRIPVEKTAVVYQGCDPLFFEPVTADLRQAVRARYHLPAEYLLSVGSIIPRKNLLGLVKGWARIVATRRPPLVVVGRGGDYCQEVKRWLAEARLESGVHFLEGVPMADLPALYQNAMAVAYLSLYEGFGIPVLEAIASRVPVMTSSISSMPEAGGEAALLVNPERSEEIGAGLEDVLYSGSVRERLLAAGPAHLERFSRERLAADLLAEYHRLA
jgi:glycosyltransferase involved in cell wall biosynthesis